MGDVVEMQASTSTRSRQLVCLTAAVELRERVRYPVPRFVTGAGGHLRCKSRGG